MNISAWSIRTPIPSIVLFLIITIAGLLAFSELGIDESPNIDLTVVSITVTQAGAAPSELETQVTRKVEDAVSGTENIKHIISIVNEGMSLTSIEFELGTDQDRAANDVRDAISRIRSELPADIEEPIVSLVNITGGPIATYTVSSDRRTVEELSWFIDNDLNRELLLVPGVGQIQRSGGVDREIRVVLDPVKLEALGITADNVNSQLRLLNINLPGGRGEVGSSEEAIRTLGSARTIEELRATRISLPRGGWARLDSLGSVTDGAAEPRQMALLDGKPVVAFSVLRSTGSNMVTVFEGVEKKLEQLRPTLPEDITIEKIRDNTRYVNESYIATVDSLVLGAALAVVVIWLFLKDWRAAGISAVAMPLSIIPTFAVMKALDFTLNNMSLLGLALVIGILVDDAIVEVENIVRHIHMGKTPYEAALEAADEIGLAVVATTFTIIAVFVPVAFMGGIPGQFFKQFGITVAVAVFFSLVVARLITPMMCAYWLHKPPHDEGRGWLIETYDKVLHWALHHRFLTVVIAVGFFVFGLVLFASLPTTLVPNVDRGELVLSVELPPGTKLKQTYETVQRLGAIMDEPTEVERVFASIGTPASGAFRSPGAGGVNKATLYGVLAPREERGRSQQELEDLLRPRLKEIPGARISFGTAQGLTGKLRIVLAGQDGELLSERSEQLIREMRTVPGLMDVTSQAALERPEIRIIPDTARAAEQGVSVASIARTAMIATLGDVDANLARYDVGERQIYIRVQLDPSVRENIEAVRRLKVSTADGRLVPLENVATVEMGAGPSQIDRYDRRRQVAIEAGIEPPLTLGLALEKVQQLPALTTLPPGIEQPPAGDAEIQRDVFRGFTWAIGAAILLIYAVLTLLFGDFLHPLTIMVSLPLSLGGAVLALLAGGEPLGLYPLIGIVMLMGLVTKNAILLVEYILMDMHRGVEREEAIRRSGEARMRPILMTTVAMIAGMVPIALGIGAGSEVRAGMAMAVIGGLVTSTFLTLLVVPVVFTYVDNALVWVRTRIFKSPPATSA